MTYLVHATVQTGHWRHSPRAEVSEDTMGVISPWLDRLLLEERPTPLPVPALADYSAQALTSPGGLVVTISREEEPLVTLGVARRERNARALWRHLCGAASLPESEPPPAPWLGVVLWPALEGDPATTWLGDLERCIAWAWIERVAS